MDVYQRGNRRRFFVPTTCQFCFCTEDAEAKVRLRVCSSCKAISYCSVQHQVRYFRPQHVGRARRALCPPHRVHLLPCHTRWQAQPVAGCPAGCASVRLHAHDEQRRDVWMTSTAVGAPPLLLATPQKADWPCHKRVCKVFQSFLDPTHFPALPAPCTDATWWKHRVQRLDALDVLLGLSGVSQIDPVSSRAAPRAGWARRPRCTHTHSRTRRPPRPHLCAGLAAPAPKFCRPPCACRQFEADLCRSCSLGSLLLSARPQTVLRAARSSSTASRFGCPLAAVLQVEREMVSFARHCEVCHVTNKDMLTPCRR